MAAKPTEFGVPGARHYWDHNTSASHAVAKVVDVNIDPRRLDVVRNAWSAILDLYFPGCSMPGFAFLWSVLHESRQVSIPGIAEMNPGVIALRTISVPKQPVPGIRPIRGPERDFLWVACKASDKDTPSEWKDALNQTAERLRIQHPNQELFLIVAVELKYMKFYWDGNRALPPQQCAVLIDGPRSSAIDDRIEVPSIMFPEELSYIDHSTGLIDTQKALSLDFWSLKGSEGLVDNHQACTNLEVFFNNIRNMVNLQGVDPALF